MLARRGMAVLMIGVLMLGVSGCELLDNLLGPILNKAPVALIQPSRTSGPAALAVTFDASECYDPDGVILNYDWAFGDGETDSGLRVTHTYTEPGRYMVTLTVTDDNGATGRDQVEIDVTEPTSGASIPLVDHAIAKDVRNGSPVDRTRSFTPSDGRVYVWFKVGPGSGTHTSAVEWYTPQGDLYVTTTDQPSGFGQPGQWASYSLWHWIGLQSPQGTASSPPSAYPGTWQIVVYVDGQRLYSDGFTLQNGTSDGGNACNVVREEPASVVEGAWERDDAILVFEEQAYWAQAGQEIDVDIDVDQLASGAVTFDGRRDLVPGQLSGVGVYSYYVHFDPIGRSSTERRMACTLSFNERVVGIILTDARLDATDSTLGFMARYPTGIASRGVDLDLNDALTLSADRSQIIIDLHASTVIDAMRVVTFMGQLR